MNMKKDTWIGVILVIAVITMAGVFVGRNAGNAGQAANSSETPAGAPVVAASTESQSDSQQSQIKSGTGPYWYQGSASLCSQGAQQYGDSLSKFSTQANTSYFVEASHYAASQNSCYFELHNLLPLPSGGNVDTYTLYVKGGPSESELSDGVVTGAEIATCSTYPNGQVQCGYYGPMKQEISMIGGGDNPLWAPTYSMTATNVPPMSYADFQSLVSQDMAGS